MRNSKVIWKSRYIFQLSIRRFAPPPKSEGRQCKNTAIFSYLYYAYAKKNPTSFKVDCTQSCVFLFSFELARYYSGCMLHSGGLIAVLYAMACGQERESCWTILTVRMKMNENRAKKIKWRQFRHFEYYCTITAFDFCSHKKEKYPFFFPLHEQRGKWTMTVCITESAIARTI